MVTLSVFQVLIPAVAVGLSLEQFKNVFCNVVTVSGIYWGTSTREVKLANPLLKSVKVGWTPLIPRAHVVEVVGPPFSLRSWTLLIYWPADDETSDHVLVFPSVV